MRRQGRQERENRTRRNYDYACNGAGAVRWAADFSKMYESSVREIDGHGEGLGAPFFIL